MAERDGDFGSFLSGFVFGGLVGAAVALLMAPQSGEETLKTLKEKGDEFKVKTTAGLDDAYARAEAAAAEAKARADELAVLARQRAEDLRDRGQVVLEEQKARFAKDEKAEEAPVEEKPKKKKTKKKED